MHSRRFLKRTCFSLFLWALSAYCVTRIASQANGQLLYQGVNLSGAEFGEHNLPGTYNGVGPGPYDYIYPPASEVDYFLSKGMNTFRLPFRWERLQRSLNDNLDSAELNRMTAFVDHATGQGAHVIIDPHNYARYHGNVIGGGTVNSGHLANFWGKLATEFKDNSKVIFGLMNEPVGANQPNGLSTETWLDAANASIDAIRDTGADNLILVPGNGYSGAHSWESNFYGTPNAEVMLDVVDPIDNFAFEVHQYLDQNSSGAPGIVSEQIGRDRLVGFTDWLKQHNYRGFLGEFATSNSSIGDSSNQIGDEAINLMLDYMDDNADVWMGWTWWGGGPWWGNYLYAIDPSNGIDRPSMDLLEPRLQIIVAPNPGDFDADGGVDLDDLDQYNGNIGAAATGALELLDLNADGTVGSDDFIQHYSNLVETSNGEAGTFAGDLNLDGVVDVLGDAFDLVENLGTAADSWAQGDVNGDGVVDVLGDAFALVENLGNTNASGTPSSTSAVPEPSGLWLVGFSWIFFVCLRQRTLIITS